MAEPQSTMTEYAADNRWSYIEEKLPPSAPSDEPFCPLCHGDWEASTRKIVSTHCGHVFHRMCILTWLHNKNIPNSTDCPCCRAPCFPRDDMYGPREEAALQWVFNIEVFLEHAIAPDHVMGLLHVDERTTFDAFDRYIHAYTCIYLRNPRHEGHTISEKTIRFLVLSRLEQVSRRKISAECWSAIMQERCRFHRAITGSESDDDIEVLMSCSNKAGFVLKLNAPINIAVCEFGDPTDMEPEPRLFDAGRYEEPTFNTAYEGENFYGMMAVEGALDIAVFVRRDGTVLVREKVVCSIVNIMVSYSLEYSYESVVVTESSTNRRLTGSKTYGSTRHLTGTINTIQLL
ncbi:hypothetical protein BDV95DRAFT_665935 [Massariosphaeria phaeospora]|uniref:RING-type domain-containing protein n=1 Tax=Massariosphaeria phaeospora TaxID=100035 RepID=A0A7C8MRL5_9PLEO|nr:hypothetical protein BDV95DRAFT_665935 [Massariosphaeria phaeospora]